MDASLALVPVNAFPPFFSRADGLLQKHDPDPGPFAREAEHGAYASDGLNRSYGSDGLEIVGSKTGTSINAYV